MELPIEILLIIYDYSCWVPRLKIRMTCKICNNFPLLLNDTLEKSWIRSFKESYNIYGIKYYQFRKYLDYHKEKNKKCDDRCCNQSCCIILPYTLHSLTNKINWLILKYSNKNQKDHKDHKDLKKQIQKLINQNLSQNQTVMVP